MSSEAAGAHADKLIGEVLASRYLIEQRLGEGAMGAVYKARHVKVGRPFAVKVLHAHLLEDKKTALRFEREAELAGRLRHPNVIGVVDVGETTDGMRYMVMDFAEGDDLATMLSEAPMPPQRIINLVRQMLEGLYHAHEAGLIHRDFKPENVIIEQDDHGVEVPRIVDFGIAILREGGDNNDGTGRLTTNGLVLGTPHYMAPEQAVADPIDHRIDLFALGIVIYEMLCGKLPFDGNGAEVARANLLLDPPPIARRVPYLEVDPLLEAFAFRLLHKKRDLRPATAKAARELLDLIDRDRAAAATALGVAPGAAAREAAITQPVTPSRKMAASEPPPMHFERPSQQQAAAATSISTPVAAAPVAAAALEVPPPIASHVATMPPQRSKQHQISTSVAEPLEYDPDLDDAPRPRRRGWLIAGGLTGAAMITTIAIVASRGHGGGEPAKLPDDKIVLQAPPQPPTVTPLEPGPGSAAEPPVPAGSATEVAVAGTGSDAKTPGESHETAKVDPAKIDRTKPDHTRVAKVDRTKPDPTKIDRTKPDPIKSDPPRIETPANPPPGTGSAEVKVASPVKTAPRVEMTKGTLGALYQSVGDELGALTKKLGKPATEDLWQKFTYLRADAAMRGTQPQIEAAYAGLVELRGLIVKRRK